MWLYPLQQHCQLTGLGNVEHPLHHIVAERVEYKILECVERSLDKPFYYKIRDFRRTYGEAPFYDVRAELLFRVGRNPRSQSLYNPEVDVVVVELQSILDDVVPVRILYKVESVDCNRFHQFSQLALIRGINTPLHNTTAVSVGSKAYTILDHFVIDEFAIFGRKRTQTLLYDVIPVKIGDESHHVLLEDVSHFADLLRGPDDFDELL
ncbi:uncharacterized protein BcabD6B2_39060 [Babesia caballi]|uniref:Uncharacterized protein n=1 Tax=Babesia caballi TaxID=5871 RepID=A0AAV4LWB2_BABCB|nr:hypothetical protein BcabD6B2_39060 [Babesia caballi]